MRRSPAYNSRMDALAFLGKKTPKLEPMYVLHGDESFLKRLVLRAIRALALGEDGDESAFSAYPGDKAAFAQVWDELESAPFFAPKRVIQIDAADPFVTKNRPLLEKKVEADALPATGVLLLDVKTWMASTRLAKMVKADRVIVCKAPPAYKLPQWCVEWATNRHQKQLPQQAAQLLVDLVGPDMGLLDQELIKLSTYVGDRARITAEDVDKLVGNNREENTWQIFDLIGQGQTGPALRVVQRLIEQGEEPMRLIGAFASQLRKVAQAARLVTANKMNIGMALTTAGVPPFGMKAAEAQLRHFGRKRALKLFDNLLGLQLDIRGNSPLPPALLLERFVIQLASK